MREGTLRQHRRERRGGGKGAGRGTGSACKQRAAGRGTGRATEAGGQQQEAQRSRTRRQASSSRASTGSESTEERAAGNGEEWREARWRSREGEVFRSNLKEIVVIRYSRSVRVCGKMTHCKYFAGGFAILCGLRDGTPGTLGSSRPR